MHYACSMYLQRSGAAIVFIQFLYIVAHNYINMARPHKLTRQGKLIAIRLAEQSSLTNAEIAELVGDCKRDTLQKALQNDEEFRRLFLAARAKEKRKYASLMDEIAAGAETFQETCYYDAENNFAGKQTVRKKNAPSFDAARYLFERLSTESSGGDEKIEIVLSED